MTKIKQLAILFAEWKNAQENEAESDWSITKGKTTNIRKDFFIADGIIDESVYEKERIKVLFLTNEANIDAYEPPLSSQLESRIDSFREYYCKKTDEWKGRMRERICSLYQVVINDFSHSPCEYAKSFAFMNLNKRGGTNNIGDGSHIRKYCELYSRYINDEIRIIAPDIIIWIGTNTFDMDIKTDCLNAKSIAGKYYLEIAGKNVPLIRMWHTSYTQINKTVMPMKEFDNIIIGRQATKLKEMLKLYNIDYPC